MDRRTELAVVAVLALVGAGLFGGLYGTFPSSTPPVNHDRGDAGAIAADFLDDQGYDVAEYRRSTDYGGERLESVYIQRTVPPGAVEETLREYHVKRWSVRYYRPDPLDRASYTVAVDPTTGEVVGFERSVPDGAHGGNLSRTAARERAMAFLDARGHDPAAYELVRNGTTERPNRTDHTFVWRDADGGVGGAPHEIRVEIHGERVGGYEAGLAVPDAFRTSHETTQSYSLVPTLLFLVLSGALGLLATYYGLRYYRAGTLDWRFGLAAGAVVAVLTLAGAVNGLPGIGAAVPPTLPPWLFYVVVLVGAMLAGTVQGTVTFVAAGAGKNLAADVLDRAPVPTLREARLDPARRTAVLYGTVRGFLLAFALLGVYAAFYAVGTRFFGVWLPASDPNATAMTTAVPAVVALVTGGVAAIWEEAVYRLFAVPACKRYLKRTSIAVVVPAFVWGLGHAGYAVLPVWARVVETTLIGVVLGYAFLRWDFLTVVSAHFTLNATVVAVPMLAAGGSLLGHGLLSAGVATLPVLAGVAVAVSGRASDATLALTWAARRRAAAAASFATVREREGTDEDG